MGNGIKSSTEIEYTNIHLRALVKGFKEVTESYQELRLTRVTLAESMLGMSEDIIFIQKVQNVPVYNMF